MSKETQKDDNVKDKKRTLLSDEEINRIYQIDSNGGFNYTEPLVLSNFGKVIKIF